MKQFAFFKNFMMDMKAHFPLIVVLMLAIAGCSDPEVIQRPVVKDSEDYFPLSAGKFIQYQVSRVFKQLSILRR